MLFRHHVEPKCNTFKYHRSYGKEKTCNLCRNTAAKRVDWRCCAFYHSHQTCCATNQVVAFYHVGGKTHNVTFQLDLQQLLQNKLHGFAARFTDAFV